MPKETASETGRRCGFAAVIGAPNAGKSTLVNALVGAKVSIVTHKAQTTRTRVRGILTTSEAERDILKAYNSHANCYIAKPLDLDQFVAVIQTIEAFWFSIVKLPQGTR